MVSIFRRKVFADYGFWETIPFKMFKDLAFSEFSQSWIWARLLRGIINLFYQSIFKELKIVNFGVFSASCEGSFSIFGVSPPRCMFQNIRSFLKSRSFKNILKWYRSAFIELYNLGLNFIFKTWNINLILFFQVMVKMLKTLCAHWQLNRTNGTILNKHV